MTKPTVEGIIKPAKHDKHGPRFLLSDVAEWVSKDINVCNNHFQKRTKTMTSDLEKAKSQIDQHIKTVSISIDALTKKEAEFVEATQKVSGRLRDSTQKLADGLARVEKTANFDRLARYADLLERVEKALSSLAELEKQGVLNRVAVALKQ